jgi:sigma-B regulation protein RsbU (phosphoserine phosphatase)
VIAAPITVQTELRGVIYLDSRVAHGIFSSDDVEILGLLGLQIGLATETARAAHAQAERAAVEKELAVTAAVQSLLLPRKTSDTLAGMRIAGYHRPAAQSGGDWWWYEATASSRLVALLADATGHGAGAAMVTAAVAGAYRAVRESAPERRGEALIVDLNSVFTRLCAGSHNMSLAVVEIDSATSAVEVWSAATPPFFISRADGTIATKAVQGALLGADDFSPGVVRFELGAGERLSFFTDGLYEARTERGRALGLRRLSAMVAETKDLAIGDACAELIRRFDDACGTSNRACADDVTVFMIERQS